MNIWLYNCQSENERVDKSAYISNGIEIEGYLRNESNIIDPVIVIEKTNPVSVLYNYMYIEEFRRWYYINDWYSIRTNIWELHAHVDVLMTWGAQIKASQAVIMKTENGDDANYYLDDGSFVMDSRKNNVVIPFTGGLDNDGQYILICAGGHSN